MAEIILGLHTCNYSLTVQELKLYIKTFEGNREADVAPVEMSVTPLDSRMYDWHECVSVGCQSGVLPLEVYLAKHIRVMAGCNVLYNV